MDTPALLLARMPQIARAASPLDPLLQQDKGQQEVQVVKRTFPIGSSSGWHVHPGVESAYTNRLML